MLLVRLASADHVAALVIDGRLAAPTGYFNSTAALFTIGALHRDRAGRPARAARGCCAARLIGFACAGLQLAVIVQSRGWLFTLPLVLIAAILVLPDRLRVVAAAVVPAAATLAVVHRLLARLSGLAGRRAQPCRYSSRTRSLRVCGQPSSWARCSPGATRSYQPRSRARRAGGCSGRSPCSSGRGATLAGGLAATHGHPFSSSRANGTASAIRRARTPARHFTDVGSGRYDFWRVALDAFVAHPIGGLGQDNFADYYVRRRRTDEEPAGRTASSCGCSRTPDWLASSCSLHS